MKHTIGDHSDVIVNFYVDATSFGPGHKFNLPDFNEPIQGIEQNKGKIVIAGSAHTKCSISAPESMLDKIELVLRNNTGKPIGTIEKIEIE